MKRYQFDNTRICRLREAMLVRPSVCVERSRLITESYRATEGEPAPIRRGKALAHLLAHMTVRIYPDELIEAGPPPRCGAAPSAQSCSATGF